MLKSDGPDSKAMLRHREALDRFLRLSRARVATVARSEPRQASSQRLPFRPRETGETALLESSEFGWFLRPLGARMASTARTRLAKSRSTCILRSNVRESEIPLQESLTFKSFLRPFQARMASFARDDTSKGSSVRIFLISSPMDRIAVSRSSIHVCQETKRPGRARTSR